MNWAHVHLMVNHVPVLGTVALTLLLAWALSRGARELSRLALWGTVVLAVATVPVYLTGEPAEGQIEHLPGVSENLIHEHEEAAEAGLIAVLVSGALAAGALWLSSRGQRAAGPLAALTLAGLLVSAGLFAWTAWTGGPIRHGELRGGAAGEAGAAPMVERH